MLAGMGLLVWPAVAAGELHPADISPAGVTGSRPLIASDGAGTVVAVWRELDGDTSAIRAAVRPAGSDWDSKRISVPAPSTESPALAVDRLGNAVALWQRSSGKDSIVQAAVRPANGDWSQPDDLSAPDELAFGANVAIDGGHVTAVWLSVRNRRRSLVSSTRTIDGSWTTPQPVADPVGSPGAPVVAVDKRGDAAVAWQTTSDGFRVIASATQPVGATWSASEILSGAARNASRPRLVMDAAGDILVGWIRSNGDWAVAQVAYRPASGSWGTPENLSNRTGNASGLDLAINTNGDAIAAWQQGSPNANLWSSSRPAGATHWRARVPVTENWAGLDSRIALDEQGNATAVWSGDATVSASFKPVDKPWQDDYLLSSYDDFSIAPAVTTQTSRKAIAVWIRAGDDDDRIQSVAYDIDTSAQEAQDEGDDSGDSGDDSEDTFLGTRHADHLVGTPGNDVFFGFGGNDVIDGRGGRDVIFGGPGNDRLVGGPGADRLYGGLGRDKLLGGRGSDFLSGDLGPDRLVGGRAGDVLVGGGGHDLLLGNQGSDILRARDGVRDRVSGGRGLDQYRLDRWLDHARSIESRFH
jgi:Ca2+-binding RTX toxin-like protein